MPELVAYLLVGAIVIILFISVNLLLGYVLSFVRKLDAKIDGDKLTFYLNSVVEYSISLEDLSSAWVITAFDYWFNPIVFFRIPIKRIDIASKMFFGKMVLINICGSYRPIVITPKNL